MKKKIDKEKAKPLKVDEPELLYQSSNLEVFSSFEDENEATTKMNASLPPEEHLRIAHTMICAMYKKELAAKKQSHDTITFTVINGLPV
jgi:hypothetical protein